MLKRKNMKNDLKIRIELITEQQKFREKYPHTRLLGVFLDAFPDYNNKKDINDFNNAIYGRVANEDVLEKLKLLNEKK